jgi:hypothetical protein
VVTVCQPDTGLRRGYRTVTIIGLEARMQASTCTVCGAYIVLEDDAWEDSHGSVLCQGENQPHEPGLIEDVG